MTTYYPDPNVEPYVGQFVMRRDSRDVYQIKELPDGSTSHQHYAITGISDAVLNRKLRISVKAMWRDFEAVRPE